MEQVLCKICGQKLEEAKDGFYQCSGCLSQFEKTTAATPEREQLERAYGLIRMGSFGDAEAICATLLKGKQPSYEAYWLRALAKNGVAFVQGAGGRMVPACQILLETDFLSDADVKKAIESAPEGIAKSYRAQSELIEASRRAGLDLASREAPCDVLICVKDSDPENGINRTSDGVYAQSVCNYLVAKGFRVFLDGASSSGNAGVAGVHNALKTAKILIVYGEKAEYFSDSRIKSAWSGFSARIKQENLPQDRLIVAYRGMDPHQIPAALLNGRKSLDLSNPASFTTLSDKVTEAVSKEKKIEPLKRKEIQGGQASKKAATLKLKGLQTRPAGAKDPVKLNADLESKVQMVYNYLAQGMWKESAEVLNTVLKQAPKNGDAQICMLLLKTQTKTVEDLALSAHFSDTEMLKGILESADQATAQKLLDVLYHANKLPPEERVALFQTILPYEYENRDKNIQNAIQNSLAACNVGLFDLLLQTLKPEEVDRYVALNQQMLSNLMRLKAYPMAQTYLSNILAVDDGNTETLRTACEIALLTNDGSFAKHFETLLKYEKDTNGCIVSFMDKILEDRVVSPAEVDALKTILAYYKGSLNDQQKNLLFIAFLLVKEKLFDAAEFFANLILAEDPKCADAWLYLCFVGTQTTAISEMANSNVPLNKCRGFSEYCNLVKEEKQGEIFAALRQQQQRMANELQQKYNAAVALQGKKRIEDLERAIAAFISIADFQDSLSRAAACEKQIEEIKAEAIRKQEEKAKAKKKRKKTTKAILISLAAVLVVAALMIMLVIPLIRFHQADTLFADGKYSAANKIYKDLDGFGDSEQRVAAIKAIDQIKKGNYEDGIKTLLAAEIPVKLTYQTGGGSLTATDTISLGQTLSLDGSVVPMAAEESTGSEQTVFDMKKKGDFKGLKTPGRNGYEFAGWDLDVFKYNVDDKEPVFTLTLRANWSCKTYTIKYDLEGGSLGGNRNVSSYTPEDEEFTLYNPTRKGYTFAGWTSEDLSEPTVNVTIASGSYGDRKYVATWKPNEYEVSLDPNGGEVTQNKVTVLYGQSYTLPVPTWAGHDFEGWYNDGTRINDGIWERIENLSLTAQWDATDYVVTYVLGGGTNALGNPSSYTVYDSFTLGEPTRRGYVFLGWTFEGQDTPVKEVTVATGTLGNKTYTANWEANKYTITLDAQGGTLSAGTLEVEFGSTVTLPTPERAGYHFDGWFAEGVLYTSGVWEFDSNLELVARWTANRYTVTFEDVINLPEEVTVTYDYNYSESTPSTVVLEDEEVLPYPQIPSRIGYVFTGWYTDSSCTNEYTFSGTLTADMTLYAGWASTYTISNISSYRWTLSNGVLTSTNKSNGSTSTYAITASVPMTVTLQYKTSSESNCDYLRIYKNGSLIASCSGISNSYYSLSVELSAGDGLSFTYSKDYSINSGSDCAYIKDLACSSATTYSSTATARCGVASGGTYDPNSNYEVEIVFGETVTLMTPTRPGYTFDGWYYGENLVESGVWSIAANATLTARWSKSQYTVTLDANGGTVADETVTVTYDSAYTLPTPTRVGYTFDGWYCDGVAYTGGTWTQPNGLTLVASWSPRTDIAYQVKHYQQNANNSEYTLESTENLTGTAGAEVTPVVKTFEHFVSPTAQTVTVAPDGSLVVNYYYDRVTYDLTYVTNGGNEIETQAYKYSQTLVVATPTRVGYTFGGWFTDAALTTPYAATATLNADTTIYAYWSEENKPTDFTYTVDTNLVTISGYSGTDTTVVIPSYIGGDPVTILSGTAFASNSAAITKLTVPQTVQTISSGAFSGCTALQELEIDSLIESDEEESIPYTATNSTSYPWTIGMDGTLTSTNKAHGSSSSYTITATRACTLTLQYKASSESGWDFLRIYKNESQIASAAGTNTSYQSLSVELAAGDTLRFTYSKDGSGSYGSDCAYVTGLSFSGGRSTITLGSLFGTTSGTGKTAVVQNGYTYYVPTSLTKVTYSATSVYSYTFANCTMLEEITLEGVESIGAHAFDGCTGLKKLNSTTNGVFNVPEGVTSIGSYAFKDCTEMTDLTLPDGVTSIGNYAFSGCIVLETVNSETEGELTLPESVETIGSYAFQNLMLITDVEISDNVTSIGQNAFSGCASLESITVPFIGSSATSGYTFSYIFGTVPNTLTTIVITSGTTIPENAFSGLATVESITVPNTVTYIGRYAFSGCSALKRLNSTTDGTLNVPTSVETIDNYAFRNLPLITTAVVPNSTTSIGQNAFAGCAALESITVPFVGNNADSTNPFSYLFGTVPNTLTTIVITVDNTIPPSAFNGLSSVESITIPTTVTSIGAYAFQNCGVLRRLNSTTDGAFNIPTGVTEILQGTFKNCLDMTGVSIPAGVTAIGNNAFQGCSQLEEVTIASESTLATIGEYAFEACVLLEELQLPATLTTIGRNAFSGCEAIAKVNSETDGVMNLPAGLETIGAYAFRNLVLITDINVPNSVTSIGQDAFYGCVAAESVRVPFVGGAADSTNTFSYLFGTVPETLTEIVITVDTTLPGGAFRDLETVESITLPATITEIGANAFQGCSLLKRLNSTTDGQFVIPSGVTAIPNYTFKDCEEMTSLTIPASVTSIGEYAFQSCAQLETVTFASESTLATIGDYAFAECISLAEIQLPTTVRIISTSAFSGCISLAKVNSTTEGEMLLPTGLTTIGVNAFQGLGAITKIVVPNTVSHIGNNAFAGCTALEELDISSPAPDTSNTVFYTATNPTTYPWSIGSDGVITSTNKSHSSSSTYTIVATRAGTLTLQYKTSSESNCDYLRIYKNGSSIASCSGIINSYYSLSVELAAGDELRFTYSKDHSVSNGSDCAYIRLAGDSGTSYTLGRLFGTTNLSGTTAVSQNGTTYYVPSSLRKVSLNTTSVAPYMFANCTMLEEVHLSGVTAIPAYAFQNCTGLKRLSSATDGAFNVPASVTAIGDYAFQDCDEMTELTIPASVTRIGAYAFQSCTQLADVEIATGNKLETVGNYAFEDCISMTEIQLPATVTAIGTYAFGGCISLAKVGSNTEGEMILPESLLTIGEYAFEDVGEITKIVVPDGVTSIGVGAFKGCNAIEEITLPFVGKSVDASAHESVFGFIFGYETKSATSASYGTSSVSSAVFVNTQYDSVEGAVWQYACLNYRYSSGSYRNTSYFYYIPTTIKNVTVTAQTVIPTAAFNGCTFLETIVLPTTVSSTGEFAYQNCPATVSQTHVPTVSTWNGTDVSTAFTGSGTEADPFQINNAADLAFLASSVNAGTSYEGLYFILNININLDENAWTPIGTRAHPFAGTFDGNGKKIYKLSVTADVAYAGLFGYVSGSIKDLGIVSGNVAPASTAASTYAGALVGFLTGSVENCYSGANVTISVTNIVYAGGLIGGTETTATVEDSYASGNVSVTTTSGFASAAGFVGTNKGTIQGSLAFGNVTAHGQSESYSRNGGFAASSEGTLTECYRSESQILTRYSAIGSAYCEDGTEDSTADMLSYAQTNWDSAVWEYDLRYPSHK